MSDESHVYRMIFSGLVKSLGGVEGAAAVLEARYGVGHKGTVSKMCNGSIAVTIDSAIALEDALGRYPITDFLADRIGQGDSGSGDILHLAANSALQHGESQEAIMSSFSEKSSDPSKMTPSELVHAIKESREAAASATKVVEALEEQQRNG